MKLKSKSKIFLLIFAANFHFILAQEVSTLASQISSSRIEALSIDKFGNLYTPTGAAGSVYKINKDGQSSIFATGLNSPLGGTTDNEGNFYVSNFNNGIITKITPSGETSDFLTGFIGPVGLAFNRNGDEFYVGDYTTNRIHKISLNDNSRTVIADRSGINGPDGLVFDDSDNLYVANFNDNNIFKITPSGEMSLFASLPGNNSGYITYANGYFYSAGFRSHKIFKISLEGEVSELAGTGVPGFQDGAPEQAQFNLPNGIAASITGDTLFIADAVNRSIRIIDLVDATTDIRTISHNLPTEFRLEQNFPNPFNPTSQINYSIAENVFVSIKVFDILGKEVATLVNELQSAGEYSTFLNANNLTSGVYFYTLTAGGYLQTKKLLVLK